MHYTYTRYLSKKANLVFMDYINYQCSVNNGYVFEIPVLTMSADDTKESWETKNSAYICIAIYAALYTAAMHQLKHVPAFVVDMTDYVFYLDHDQFDVYYTRVYDWLMIHEEYELLPDFISLRLKLNELNNKLNTTNDSE
jgi:hypothetical protein